MVQHKPIDQQVVVIIGASSGIGKVTAMEFGAKGAKLVIADRSRAGLEATSSEIMSRGGQVVWVVADVTSTEQVRKLFLINRIIMANRTNYNKMREVAQKAIETYGRIDTWVHNSGQEIFTLSLPRLTSFSRRGYVWPLRRHYSRRVAQND